MWAWLTVSNILTILVIVILLIDIVYRIKYRGNGHSTTSVVKSDSAFKEIFRDFKDQLSFTRVATAVVILAIFIAIGIGWWWPHLQAYCTTAYDKLLDFAKMLFGIGKTPEAVNQLNGMFKSPAPSAAPPPTPPKPPVTPPQSPSNGEDEENG